jgi:hypothetical protein
MPPARILVLAGAAALVAAGAVAAASPRSPDTIVRGPLDPLGLAGTQLVAPVDASAGAQVSDPAAGIIETFAGGAADGATALQSTF